MIKIHLAGTVLFLCLLLSACGKKAPAESAPSAAAKREDVSALVEEGRSLLEEDDPEKAAELFREAMRKDPKNADARVGAARVQIRRGAYDVASDSLGMAAKIAPDNHDIYEAYLELARASDSTSYARQAVSLAEWNGQSWFTEAYVPENAVPDPAPGSFGDDTFVSLAADGEGEIHYTLKRDGKTLSSGVYTAPLRLLRGKTSLQVWVEKDKVPCTAEEYVYDCDYPETARSFEDPAIEAMVRAELKKDPGDTVTNYECEEITSLSWYDLPYDNGGREQYQVRTLRDLGNLPACTSLTIQEQKGVLPLSELRGTAVTTLSVSRCGIRDLSFAKDLPGLRTLRLSGNEISDVSGLEALVNLQTLDLQENPVTGLDEYLKGKKIQSLTLDGKQLNDLAVLSEMKDLHILVLNDAEGHDFSKLKDLKNLTELDLLNCGIEDLSFLSEMKQLEYLDLSGNYINDISILSDFKNLENLDLASNRLTDLRPLEELTALRYLYLSDNQELSDITPLKNLKNLTHLYLRDTNVTEEAVEELEKALPGCTVSY